MAQLCNAGNDKREGKSSSHLQHRAFLFGLDIMKAYRPSMKVMYCFLFIFGACQKFLRLINFFFFHAPSFHLSAMFSVILKLENDSNDHKIRVTNIKTHC